MPMRYWFEHESEEFVASLDRSTLGSFAVDTTILTLTDILYRRSRINEFMRDTMDGISKRLESELARHHTSSFDAIAELFYWWNKTSESKLKEHHIFSYQPRMRLLDKVAVAGERVREFYEHGIWDDYLIEKCIRDGVDPEIAARMVTR